MEQNMTEGKEWPIILRFALPLMGASLLQTLYSFVDSVIVGQFVGETAFGAIGLLASSIMLVNFLCTSLGNGVSIVTSQFVGAGQKDQVKINVMTAQILSLAVSAVVIVVCLAGSVPLIRFVLRTPDNMVTYSLQYFQIYAAGLFFQFIYQVCYGILRAHGDSRGAMLFLLIAALLNVGLDLLFVVGFRMEVLGAVLATVIAQAGSAAASVIYLYRRYPQYSLFRPENRIWESEKALLIGKISLPIMLQTSVLSIGFIILQRLVNSFGAASIEGFAAEQKVESFIHILPSAFSTAMANFTGQNIGAGKTDRIRRGFRHTVLAAVGASAVIAVIMIAFDTRLLSIFHISGEGLVRGAAHLDLLVIFMLPNAAYTIAAGLLQGAGDVRITAVSSFINLTIRVVSAYFMAATRISYQSIWWSLPLAWSITCIINLSRYKSGIWEHKSVISKN